MESPSLQSGTSCDLSILVVNWNTVSMTCDCLRSVLDNLGSLSAEIIVVDNGSTDGSADRIAQDFPDVHLIRNSDNLGFAAANNQALAVARGRCLLLLNSDTLVHGDVLSRSVAFLMSNPGVGAMGCRVLNTDQTVQMTCAMYPSLANLLLEMSGLWKLRWPQFLGRYHMTHWMRDSQRDVDTISGCYLMLRRHLYEEVGALDESFFFFGEETDWCRRFRVAGHRLVFAPVGEITHFGGGTVRKLNHRRDVMLSEAVIRLHRKHDGRLAACLAFAIIMAFNGSRAAFWSLAAVLQKSQKATERARHFRAVLRDSRDVMAGLRA